MSDPTFADLIAALNADRDQRESALGEILGVKRQVPEGFLLYVSPDIGQRLTRDGVIPERVRISWHLPPNTAYSVDPSIERPGLPSSFPVGSVSGSPKLPHAYNVREEEEG